MYNIKPRNIGWCTRETEINSLLNPQDVSLMQDTLIRLPSGVMMGVVGGDTWRVRTLGETLC